MRRKRLISDARGLIGTGMILGLGGSAIGAMPAAPAGVGAGIAAFGSMMPAYGTALGGSYAIDAAMGIIPKTRRRQKR